MTDFYKEKSFVLKYFKRMEEADSSEIPGILNQFMSTDYRCHAVYPFNLTTGQDDVAENIWVPLYKSFHMLKRHQNVFIAGEGEVDGKTWVMSMGHLMGLFEKDWLGIRATRKTIMLRYAEFHCVEDAKITQSGLFFDIIGLMQLCGINPLPPSTGQYFVYPGPRNCNGIILDPQPRSETEKTLTVINQMVDDLTQLNQTANDHCPPELLAKSWHEDMVWYGPAGIGASYSIKRYQMQHQYPFRENLKDKIFNGHISRFAEGEFACFFGWPNLTNTPTGGFLGMPGGEVKADMRVVDVYRRQGDKLLENWVFIDLLYWLKQQGLDILERTRNIYNPPAGD